MRRTDLPETCLSTMPGTGELIVLKRGETGYYRSEWNTNDAERNKQIADDHNLARGLTPAQVEAMRVGSMFGFAVPGANPQRYLDLAKQEEKFHVDGHIKDTVISLYHPITCDLLNYKVVGKVVTYLEPIALPDSMMGTQSGIMLFAEMVGGEPLIPVLATQSLEKKYTFGLAEGCFSHSTEANQDYHIIAKVRVGAKEFVLAESPTRHPAVSQPGRGRSPMTATASRTIITATIAATAPPRYSTFVTAQETSMRMKFPCAASRRTGKTTKRGNT